MDTFDITGLDANTAKEYVLAAITTLNETRKKREELERDRELWAKRVELAKQHGKDDLLETATSRLGEITAYLEKIKAEEAELHGGVIRLKGQLKLILNQPELEVDTDQLLAMLELSDVHKPDELAEKFRDQEAEEALQKLKEEMEKEKKGE
jgi:phage shock protein A